MDRVLFLCLITILEGGLLLEKADSAKISCKTCKEFVKSFHERLEATANSNYAGGDTSWEEENLGSYSNSEVRLVEMLDAICSKSDYNCHRLLEEAEEDIERWWLKWRKQDGKGDLDSWLCFTHLDVCCPENTFGPSCQDCPGSPNNTCGGRGRCEGSGEKDGKGTCKCDTGYAGDLCQSCDSKYFQEKDAEGDKEDEESGDLVCKECDRSCDKSCDGPGPGDCDSCAEGYKASEDGVCEDVDECKIDGDTRCKEGDYCLNNPGSFSCLDCDKACKKICNGPGPSKCAECAVGYTRNEQGVCQDDDECSSGGAKCSEGTYCDNSPGSYVCKACHVACLSGCYGPGGKGCIACKEGYSMNEDDGCKDIDECEVEPSPCDSEKEVCSNLVGTYVCKCKEGLVKGEDGKCVTEEERDRQVGERTMKNQKKKKKKKKKSKKASRKASLPEGEGEKEVGKGEVGGGAVAKEKEEEGEKEMKKGEMVEEGGLEKSPSGEEVEGGVPKEKEVGEGEEEGGVSKENVTLSPEKVERVRDREEGREEVVPNDPSTNMEGRVGDGENDAHLKNTESTTRDEL